MSTNIVPAADALDSRSEAVGASAPSSSFGPPRLARAVAPERLGAYRYLGELGHGGMGVVYRMIDDATGQVVAVKTALTKQHRVVGALRAEMSTLQRIRHPGVVQIIGSGTANGLPWYAMELLGPSTIASFTSDLWRAAGSSQGSGETLKEAPKAPTTAVTPAASPRAGDLVTTVAGGRLSEALALYRKLAAVLAHVHGLGLVHRDLKPPNVFLRQDGSPVLADFGLASRAFASLGRSALSHGEERLLGTPAYVSPEQILGQFVDARADLYSFGCMLFEALTGRPPFLQMGDVSILQQHLRAVPVPPSEYVSGVQKALDELVLRLLAKDARQRALSAEQVADELSRLAGAPPSEPAQTPISYLYRPTLAGREEALVELGARRASARSGAGSLVVLSGESGIGKTFLACEAIRLAALDHFLIVTAECQPVAAGGSNSEVSGAPLHAFRSLLQAMADRCVERGAEHTAWLLGDSLRLLADYEAELRDLPGYAEQPELEPLPVDTALRRLLSGLSESLCRFADGQPLLLAIDDLQWADELSLTFLRFFVESQLATRAIWIVATVRAEETSDVVRDLCKLQAAHTIALGRLDAITISRLASDMLSVSGLPQRFVDFLVRHSEGNPFFVAEYLRASAAEGLLERHDGAWRVSADLDTLLDATGTAPSSIQELVVRRLGGLTDATRTVLEAAAVLGREFAPELLKGAARAEEQATLRAVELLRARQILETAAAGALRFVHDRLREAAYAAILPPQRRELHRRAAQLLETQYRDSAELSSQHAVLARHWSAARAPRRALHHFTKAAHAARSAFAVNDAVSYFHGAIREAHELLSTEDDDRQILAELYESLGELESRAGRQQLAREAFERGDACLSVEQGSWRARLARKLGKTFELENRHGLALEALSSAEQRLGPPPPGAAAPSGWHSEWLDIQIQRAWACYWTARLSDMSALLAETTPIVERAGSATQRAQFYQVVALLHMCTERFLLSDESLDWARRAYEASLEAEPLTRPAIQFTWAFCLLFRGRLQDARPELERVLAAAERAGDTAVRCRAMTYLLLIARRHGRVEETRSLAERTLAIASASQMKHYIGAAQASLGWASFRDGQVDLARSFCEAALASWRSALPSTFPFQWLARWPLIALGIETGDLQGARETLRALREVSEQRMPESVAEHVERVLQATTTEDLAAALNECLTAAMNEGFL